MTTKYKNRATTFSIVSLLGLLTVSCGSYQGSSYYDSDGIYNAAAPVATEAPVAQKTENTTNASADAYREYFNRKAEEIDDLPDNSMYFTDIDAYSSTPQDTTDVETSLDYDYVDGYAGWGQNATDVTVNVYNNSPYYGYGWGGYWGYSPYRYSGWYSPYWSAGWYSPYWYGYSPYGYYGGYSPYYGYGYYGGYYGYYGGGYYNHHPYYRRNNVAYANGRRGSAQRGSVVTRNSTRSAINATGKNASINRRNTNNTVQTRSQQNTRNNSDFRVRTRNMNPTTPNNNTRSYTPQNNNTRSYSPSTPSYSPGRSGGGGGGGRSGGGGGRRG